MTRPSRVNGKCPICGGEVLKAHIYCLDCAEKVRKSQWQPKEVNPHKQAQTGNDLPFEFECSYCGKVVEITERSDKRSRFCCAAHEKQYWRVVTRHPTHLTNKLYWELFTDVNKYDK